jgi:hypothetical protein
VRKLVGLRFAQVCAGEAFDPDRHGYMVLAEPGNRAEDRCFALILAYAELLRPVRNLIVLVPVDPLPVGVSGRLLVDCLAARRISLPAINHAARRRSVEAHASAMSRRQQSSSANLHASTGSTLRLSLLHIALSTH